MIGQTISHYRITDKLGEGGMGVVFKAEDLDLGVTRALKFLPEASADDDRQLVRLKREAWAAATLEHPNICPVHEIGHADGKTFIVMSYLEGATLADQLAATGRLPVDQAITIAAELGDALKCAHASGIVHRDIKPSNIMLTDTGRAVVLDFGLATATDLTKMTRTGTTLGTAAYMSPEQARGEAADARSDLWALGAVLYESLTGQVPFPGENLAVIVHNLQNDEPASLTKLRPDAPPALQPIIDRALAKDPEQRYQTADEFLHDLAALRAGQELSAGTRRYRPHQERGRRRWLAVSALVVLVAVSAMTWRTGFHRAHAIDALAVLPFANLSGDEDQEYFADGMTEALITELQQLTSTRLRVIGRTSVMRYKDTELSLPEIADELNVDALVEASVVRSGDRVRIAAKLIRARPEEQQMWAESYERRIENILMLHDEIARTLAEQIQIVLNPTIATIHEVDPQAYEEYLIASHILHSKGDVEEALTHLERSMEIDPDYAAAWTAAAHCTLMPVHVWPFPRKPIHEARRLVEHAIELDPEDAEAWFVLGHILYEHEFEMDEADEAFQRALELNPSQGRGLLTYAFFATATNRMDEAADAARRAIAADPFDWLVLARGYAPLMTAGRFEEFRAEIDRLRKINPDLDPEFRMPTVHQLRGEYEQAIEILERWGAPDNGEECSVFTNEPFAAGHLRTLANLYYSAGQVDQARDLANEWLTIANADSLSQTLAAEIYAVLGDYDRAYACIDSAYSRRDIMFVRINDPAISGLSRLLGGDLRFEERLKRFGLKR